MPFYLYYCPYCDHSFEIRKPMAKADENEQCPRCGIKSLRRYTPLAHTFGWRLTAESCHVRGHKDELEKDL